MLSCPTIPKDLSLTRKNRGESLTLSTDRGYFTEIPRLDSKIFWGFHPTEVHCLEIVADVVRSGTMRSFLETVRSPNFRSKQHRDDYSRTSSNLSPASIHKEPMEYILQPTGVTGSVTIPPDLNCDAIDELEWWKMAEPQCADCADQDRNPHWRIDSTIFDSLSVAHIQARQHHQHDPFWNSNSNGWNNCNKSSPVPPSI